MFFYFLIQLDFIQNINEEKKKDKMKDSLIQVIKQLLE